jgi:hypothetical protein
MHPEGVHTCAWEQPLHLGDDEPPPKNVLQNFTELASHGNPFLYETCQHSHTHTHTHTLVGHACTGREKARAKPPLSLLVRFQRLTGGHHSQEVTDALLQRLENITILIKLETSGRTLDPKPLAS